MEVKQLSIGLVCSGGIYDEVIKEVLNHQGILFKEIQKRPDNYEKFPCIILPHYVDEDYELARKHSEDEDNIIIAEREIPLNAILNALGGKFESSSTDLIYPIINQYEIEFLKKIKEKHRALDLPLMRKWFWPGFSKACCIMTHDIDWLYYSPWHFAVMRNKSVPQLIKLAYQSLIHKRNYGNNIPEIILKEKQRNIRSSFYFLTKCRVYQQEFFKILERLKKENFEIGLHGSLSSYKNFNLLKNEKDELEEYAKVKVKGIRQHELKFLTPLTWKYQEEAAFAYDLTFYYNDKIGFRSGICFPYHPINVSENKKFSILEIPTSFMDWTVLSKSYDELFEIVAKLEEIVENLNGCLVMNFHNCYQNRETFPQMERLYSDILDYVKEMNYWVTTANDCWSWWLKRETTVIDAVIKEDLIKGRTSTYPFPLVIEKSGDQRTYLELQEANFKINL